MSETKTLTLNLKDKQALHAAYMPFLKRGGLFIPTSRSFLPGDRIEVNLQLPEEPDPIKVYGTMVWRTPVGAQGRKTPGIGVHFAEDEDSPRYFIEDLLAGLLNTDKPTHTL
ncbi:type IV pilus assembly protein PilZ [Marinospirillum celere]|uniref:Type IV pilus assembly protein PilZ n=1 Tax=Marinospirillum celere TaxID=1122252 RepID=A0A1I1EX78_9GAMM|nr:PilZ domain-containing protein [Marinospirillum celere]SFB91262.1 type IV pilus assembly protein PilZ [Marinospirillum celere]